MTNSSSARKKEDLERISDELELDLKVELVPLVKVDKNQRKASRRYQKIRVTFPDGRVIQPNKVSDTLLEVVKYASTLFFHYPDTSVVATGPFQFSGFAQRREMILGPVIGKSA